MRMALTHAGGGNRCDTGTADCLCASWQLFAITMEAVALSEYGAQRDRNIFC